MSKTDFLTKAEILGEFWASYKDEPNKGDAWEEFFAAADVGLPLAYFISTNDPIAFLNEYGNGRKFIEQTWEWYCSYLNIDSNELYEDMEDTFEASPNDPIEE